MAHVSNGGGSSYWLLAIPAKTSTGKDTTLPVLVPGDTRQSVAKDWGVTDTSRIHGPYSTEASARTYAKNKWGHNPVTGAQFSEALTEWVKTGEASIGNTVYKAAHGLSSVVSTSGNAAAGTLGSWTAAAQAPLSLAHVLDMIFRAMTDIWTWVSVGWILLGLILLAVGLLLWLRPMIEHAAGDVVKAVAV